MNSARLSHTSLASVSSCSATTMNTIQHALPLFAAVSSWQPLGVNQRRARLKTRRPTRPPIMNPSQPHWPAFRKTLARPLSSRATPRSTHQHLSLRQRRKSRRRRRHSALIPILHPVPSRRPATTISALLKLHKLHGSCPSTATTTTRSTRQHLSLRQPSSSTQRHRPHRASTPTRSIPTSSRTFTSTMFKTSPRSAPRHPRQTTTAPASRPLHWPRNATTRSP